MILDQVAAQGRKRGLVVLAGAGLSAGEPSALPSWKALNKCILESLRSRLEAVLGGRANRLNDFNAEAAALLDEDRFPPEYQAQVIEEMCGDRYFRALQSLDVDVSNAGHELLAALAGCNAIKAIVTTNFDKLIEKALDQRGVDYDVAFDDYGFKRICELSDEPGRLQVIKIHGCVSDHRSMIDTLKQRQRGTARHLQACLDALGPSHWLYLGFSAADLESNKDYLGLVHRARNSLGGTYVSRPPKKDLKKGALLLMDAHGDRGSVQHLDIANYLGGLCKVLGAPTRKRVHAGNGSGFAEFTPKLREWAESLSGAAAGLCLAAIYEAVGNGEASVRVLDRLVRKELYDERETPDFRALQLHYGRLGAVWGRFTAVPDLYGAASNASVETVQSLLRIQRSELGFAASTWLPILWLWMNKGGEAMTLAEYLMNGLINGNWENSTPRTKEEIADAWIAASQVFLIDDGEMSPSVLAGTVELALKEAKEAGDVVRVSRIAALYLVGLGRTTEDVPGLMEDYSAEFDQAKRVGDGFSLGMRSLALGRWYVGPGGLALAAASSGSAVARKALEHLQTAISFFERQGMDPWILYSEIQMTKALGDLHEFKAAETLFDERINPLLQRFPILGAHAQEAAWQLQRMLGRDDAVEYLDLAVQAAALSSLAGKYQMLQRELSASRQA